jgi:hypothetical protein
MGVVLAVKVLEQVARAMPNEVPPPLFTMRMDGHGSDGSKEMTAGHGDLNPTFTRSYCVAGFEHGRARRHAESPGGRLVSFRHAPPSEPLAPCSRSVRRRSPAPTTVPAPPDTANHFLIVVLDSLRFDAWIEAAPSTLAKLGPVQRRFSYATWTAPSHYNLLMGLLPHTSPAGVYASEYYKDDFRRYSERLGIPDIEFKSLVPSLFLPTFLKHTLGYRTHAMVSMPVLNERTLLNKDFDTYRLMDRHNDMRAMLGQMHFETDAPSFHLLNVGETHYPYARPDEPQDQWPRIPGVHGVVRSLDAAGADHPDAPFDPDQLAELRLRQIQALEYLDSVFADLFRLLPRNTWVVVTSDHGELFGEEGYFGHGPINHEKVLEVPFVEGMVP